MWYWDITQHYLKHVLLYVLIVTVWEMKHSVFMFENALYIVTYPYSGMQNLNPKFLTLKVLERFCRQK